MYSCDLILAIQGAFAPLPIRYPLLSYIVGPAAARSPAFGPAPKHAYHAYVVASARSGAAIGVVLESTRAVQRVAAGQRQRRCLPREKALPG
jgi:hypothetical protein